MVSISAQALAWSVAHDSYDSYRNPRVGGLVGGKNVDWMGKVSEEQYRK